MGQGEGKECAHSSYRNVVSAQKTSPNRRSKTEKGGEEGGRFCRAQAFFTVCTRKGLKRGRPPRGERSSGVWWEEVRSHCCLKKMLPSLSQERKTSPEDENVVEGGSIGGAESAVRGSGSPSKRTAGEDRTEGRRRVGVGLKRSSRKEPRPKVEAARPPGGCFLLLKKDGLV